MQSTHTQIIPIQSRDGKTYWCDAEDTLYTQRFKSANYQSTNWSFIQPYVRPHSLCLDVGANNGGNTIWYAEHFDWVHAWEPSPLAQQLWSNTIRDNSVTNVTFHASALGESHHTTDIVIHEKNGGHNHLENSNRPRWSGKRWQPRNPTRKRIKQMVSVQVDTMDSFNLTNIAFIKVDVEGYEWFVLQGGESTILRERPIIQLEIVANQCRKFGYWAEDMIAWMRQRDYRVCSKRRGWLDGEFKSHRTHLLHNGQIPKRDMDYFFIPKEMGIKLPPKLELFAQGETQ